jgi:hypothetical protein
VAVTYLALSAFVRDAIVYLESISRWFSRRPLIESIRQQILAFVHYEKHSDIFRTEAKKIEIDKALTLEHYTPIKCSFRLVHVLRFDCALHQ